MGQISGTVGICIKGTDGVVRIFNGGQSQASASGFISEKDRIFTTPDGVRDFGISVRYECTGTCWYEPDKNTNCNKAVEIQ